MGMNDIIAEDVPQGKKKKQKSDDDDDGRKKKVEIHIVCCTIM
tara:strand:+ start:1620 stop:1748 length:129 start_codon:yes stop_codon:yes gene_type:complete